MIDSHTDPIARYAGSLDGRVVIVTGAGSGIGRATAVALARAGADVACVGRRPEPLDETASSVRALGRRSLAAPCDVADPSAVHSVVAETVSSLGPPDIAVLNAGVNAWGELGELTPGDLRAALAVNVEGVANVARELVPGMRGRRSGKLVVVASDNGRKPEAGGSGYVASKFGSVGFALSLSRELYASGVSVHVVEPGCVDTDWYAEDDDVPRERMLRPEDVALLILFLATLPSSVILEEVMPLPRGLLAEPWD